MRYPQWAISHPRRVLLSWLGLGVAMVAAIALSPRLQQDLTSAIAGEDLFTLGAAPAVVLLSVTALVLRCWQGVVGTLLVVVAALGAACTATSLLDLGPIPPLGMTVAVLTALGMQQSIYLGLAYCQRVYHERGHPRPAPGDHRFLLSEAMRDVREPLALSTVVAAIAFGALYAAGAPELRVVSVALIAGLATTSLAATTIHPALLALFPVEVPDRHRRHAHLQRAIDRACDLAAARPRLVLSLALAILAVGALGSFQIAGDGPARETLGGAALWAFGGATLLIGLLLSLGLGSLLLGALTLVPILLPPIVACAVLALAGRPLALPAAIAAAAALGILSAGTIHTLKAWRARWRTAGNDTIAAAAATLSAVGLPVLLSAVAVAAAAVILMLSRHDAQIWIGALLGVAAATSAAWTLIGAPALLQVFGNRPPRTTTEDTSGVSDFRKVVADQRRTSFTAYTDVEIERMTTADFLALAGKTVIRHGGSHGTRRMLVELEVRPNQRILELGAGVGTTAFGLLAAEPTIHVTGVDLSAYMIEQARRRAKELGLEERTTFIQTTDPNKLPFDDGSFDLVLVESVAMYNDADRLFQEIFRVLAPGGRVGLHDWCWIERPSLELEQATCVVACGCNPGDVKFFTQADWEGSLTGQGFDIRFAEEYPFTFFSLSAMIEDEGTWGVIKMFARVLARRATARRMFRMVFFLAQREGMYGYTVTIGQKPQALAAAAVAAA